MTVVMIKPTNSCNLGCAYCYNSNQALPSQSTMALETMKKSLELITRYENSKGRNVVFEWIGGEPLLVGMDFFQHVVDLTTDLTAKGYKLEHCVQSNGLLMNAEKASFFAENNIEFSFSLDGIETINNATRKYKNGKGAFHQILNGIRDYRNTAGRCGVVCVVTRQNYKNLMVLYDLCKAERIGLQLNHLVVKGRAKENGDQLYISPDEYVEAVMTVFNKWLEDSRSSHGTESVIEDSVKAALIKNGRFGTCIDKPISCQDYHYDNFICVNPQGDVYPCTSFDNEPDFYLGNINHCNDFMEIAEGNKRGYLAKRNERVFTQCGIQEIGCMHNAYIASGNIDSVDPFTTARKNIQELISEKINLILESSVID